MVHIVHTINDGNFHLPAERFQVFIDAPAQILCAVHKDSEATIRWPISQILCWETAPAEDIEPEVSDPDVWVTENRHDLPA